MSERKFSIKLGTFHGLPAILFVVFVFGRSCSCLDWCASPSLAEKTVERVANVVEAYGK